MKFKVSNIEFVSCHRKPERSFHWRGKQFPLCARCTGIHMGYLTFPIFLFGFFKIGWIWTLLLIFPTILDGVTQAFFNRNSTNGIRFVTGLLAGVGLMSLVSFIGQSIGEYILFIIN